VGPPWRALKTDGLWQTGHTMTAVTIIIAWRVGIA
jgi:hypothetical protein